MNTYYSFSCNTCYLTAQNNTVKIFGISKIENFMWENLLVSTPFLCCCAPLFKVSKGLIVSSCIILKKNSVSREGQFMKSH